MRRATIAILSVALAGSAGCKRDDPQQTLTVFAAASLTESFRELEQAYEAEHPELDVDLNFAGSQLLAAQLLEGAPAQVFASADSIQLDRVAVEHALVGRRGFASNRIVIAVPVGSAIQTLADLGEPGVRVVLAGESVPAGRYARAALEQLSTDGSDLRGAVERNVVSNETSVRGVVARVRMGEADAGMVYATDVAGDPELELRELPELPYMGDGRAGFAASYELAVLAEGSNATLRSAAMEFAEFVTSPAGQAILAEHGFSPVSAPAPT